MSLDRHAEALAALEVALRHAPAAPVLLEAEAEARLLLRMQARDARALASASPAGDTDVVGIPRGRCFVRTKAGEECVCTGYVQRHTSMKIQLDGRCASCPAPPPPPPHAPPPTPPAPPPHPPPPRPSQGRSEPPTSPSCSCASAAATRRIGTSTSSTRGIGSSTREIDSHRHPSRNGGSGGRRVLGLGL
jgi:hypothetical protein